ncbi:hypothetical protein IPM09_01755 [Candidatus Saccharibacteria bacterium]|nr:MAG: hypothetical protein IPM09_01755 [Candidatus Saccharibacteria bacterium]
MPEFTHLLNGATVKFHGYREAQLTDHALAVPRDVVREFENELYKLTNANPANHVVFEIKTRGGTTIAFRFSDFYMYVGTTVKVGTY